MQRLVAQSWHRARHVSTNKFTFSHARTRIRTVSSERSYVTTRAFGWGLERGRKEPFVGVRKVAVEKVSSYARPHEPHAPPYGIRPTCLLETNDIGEFIDRKMGRCPILPPTKVSQLCGVCTYNVIGALRSGPE